MSTKTVITAGMWVKFAGVASPSMLAMTVNDPDGFGVADCVWFLNGKDIKRDSFPTMYLKEIDSPGDPDGDDDD